VAKKNRFKPVINRIKLNPEQAVLTCDCYDKRFKADSALPGASLDVCMSGAKGMYVKNHLTIFATADT
jgi:hypothetical protein